MRSPPNSFPRAAHAPLRPLIPPSAYLRAEAQSLSVQAQDTWTFCGARQPSTSPHQPRRCTAAGDPCVYNGAHQGRIAAERASVGSGDIDHEVNAPAVVRGDVCCASEPLLRHYVSWSPSALAGDAYPGPLDNFGASSQQTRPGAC